MVGTLWRSSAPINQPWFLYFIVKDELRLLVIIGQEDIHMILGIGTDLVEIERIKGSIERNTSLVNKIFTRTEIRYCKSKKHPHQHYAARFAAKEALFKAIGTGWDVQINWLNVSIENEVGGKPTMRLYGKAKALADNLGIRQIHLSLTHTGNIAGAHVVLES